MVKTDNDIWGRIPLHDSRYKSTTNVTKSTTNVTKAWTDSHIKSYVYGFSPKSNTKIEYLNTYLQFLTQFLNCKYAGKNSDSDTFIGR